MNELSLLKSLFDDGFGFPTYRTRETFVPKVDVKQTKNAYILEMDLPGLTENDLDIDLKDNVLKIASVKNQEEEKPTQTEDSAAEKDETVWIINERKSAEFDRRFTLPRDIDAEKITASFKNGVLCVNIPRKEEESPKKIQISVA